MAIAAPPQSTAISAGSKEAQAFIHQISTLSSPDHVLVPPVSPLLESKLILPPPPINESPTNREGREGEERLARVIATRLDVSQVVRHPKHSIADTSGLDLSVDFIPESDQVSVHVQGKCSLNGLNDMLREKEVEIWKKGGRMKKDAVLRSVQEMFIEKRVILLISDRSDEHILKYFDRGNQKIQARARLERSRAQPVTVFASV